MKKVISFCQSLTNSWSPWGGQREQSSTSQSSETDSCCKKYEKRVLEKMLLLLEENERLKEELRLRDLQENAEYDL
jgi:hypothetical protein